MPSSRRPRWFYPALAAAVFICLFALVAWRADGATYPRFVGRFPHEHVPHDDHEIGTYTDGYRIQGDFHRVYGAAQRELRSSDWHINGSAAGGSASFQSLQRPTSGNAAHEQVIVLTRRGGIVDVTIVRYSQPSLWDRAKRWASKLL